MRCGRGRGRRVGWGSRCWRCSGRSGAAASTPSSTSSASTHRLAGADLVITGEGSLDAQTLAGKAVSGVARRATTAGVPVVAVCGRCTLTPDDLATLGVRRAYPLTVLEPDEHRSMSGAADLLRETGRAVAREWLSRAPG